MKRNELLAAIQAYAEEWATGKSIMHSPAKVALCIALDRYEFGVIEAAQTGRHLRMQSAPCCFCNFDGSLADAMLPCSNSPNGRHCSCWSEFRK
jgi:hypothetical protein